MKITPDPTGNGSTIVDTHGAVLPAFVAACAVQGVTGTEMVALEVEGPVLGAQDRVGVLFILEPEAAALICAQLVVTHATATAEVGDAFQRALDDHVATLAKGRM